MSTWSALVSRIHDTDSRLVLYATGGGSLAISDLLTVPGASRTVIEALVPYDNKATVDILGVSPESFCSTDCAALLAERAFRRAIELTALYQRPVIGVACTAALATGRQKAGGHRAHIACHTGVGTHTYDIALEKGAHSRAEEERTVADAILATIACHSGVPDDKNSGWPTCVTEGFRPLLPGFKGGAEDAQALVDGVEALLNGSVRCVEVSGPPERRRVVVNAPRCDCTLLPGSFNPLHDGHKELLHAARATAGTGLAMFELCIRNPDKGAISREAVLHRLAPFAEQGLPIVLTNASLFTDKARLFRGCAFAVGYDTAVRLLDRKYYQDSESEMAGQFVKVATAGCRFVVAGRLAGNGEFRDLEDVVVPPLIEEMQLFLGVDEEDFRMDISSSEIRAAAGSSEEESDSQEE